MRSPGELHTVWLPNSVRYRSKPAQSMAIAFIRQSEHMSGIRDARTPDAVQTSHRPGLPAKINCVPANKKRGDLWEFRLWVSGGERWRIAIHFKILLDIFFWHPKFRKKNSSRQVSFCSFFVHCHFLIFFHFLKYSFSERIWWNMVDVRIEFHRAPVFPLERLFTCPKLSLLSSDIFASVKRRLGHHEVLYDREL